MKEFELYLDESGRFTEGLSADERPPFPSQLAGVVAPLRFFRDAAPKILGEVFAELREELPGLLHATEMARGERFDRMVIALTEALGSRPGLQAVRLENREGVGFGAIEATYTRMVAELCVRVLEQLSRTEREEIGLRLIGATYMIEGESKLPEEAYVRRLQEHFAYAAVRRGLAAESERWRVLGVRTGSGTGMRELQICDVLSNASHAGYQKLGDAAEAALRAAFGAFDFQMTVRDLDRRLDEYLDDGALGLALRAVAEELVGEELSDAARKAIEPRLQEVVEATAALPAPSRAAQLLVLDSWLEELNEQLRNAELGYRAAQWLLEHVDAKLRAALGEHAFTVDAFTLSLHRHSLTAANHRGALGDASAAYEAFEALMPSLAGRWEHGPLVIDGLIAQAVHLTDCFEYQAAARRAGAVADYYATLSDLLGEALEGVFPREVRSEQRGQALGTQMQAEMYAGLSDPSRFARARELNEEARAEFASPADAARQDQYRAQLETFAGEYGEALGFLSRSLGVEATHESVGTAIARLAGPAQGFALLHWLRLGASILADGDKANAEAFAAALKSSKLHDSRWCTELELSYPAHGVRRQLAVIYARRGDNRAESTLGQLRRLQAQDSPRHVLALGELAGTIEVAALLIGPARKKALRFLDLDDAGRPGAVQQVRVLSRLVETAPALKEMLRGWSDVLGQVLSGKITDREARDALLGCTRVVGY